MISRVAGQVVELGSDRVVLDVGGLGYEILVPQPLLEKLKIGEPAVLLTHHHVRENIQELYGFAEAEAKLLFEQLLGVSGVGPKSALAIMSLGDQERLRSAIATEDASFIATAVGVGKRSAERVIVELKDKVGDDLDLALAAPADDAAAALKALGYSAAQASQALRGIEPGLPVEIKVKQALRKLS
jgi:Holliday junction DNA helicase RuvA